MQLKYTICLAFESLNFELNTKFIEASHLTYKLSLTILVIGLPNFDLSHSNFYYIKASPGLKLYTKYSRIIRLHTVQTHPNTFAIEFTSEIILFQSHCQMVLENFPFFCMLALLFSRYACKYCQSWLVFETQNAIFMFDFILLCSSPPASTWESLSSSQ